MNTSPAKKIATVLGAGSLLLAGATLAPAASAAPVTGATAVVAGATAPAPAATSPAAAGPRTALVAAWYQQFLGRSADAGAQHWVVRLREEAPAVVLADLLRTPEHVGAQVDDLYEAYLGRGIEGDPGADLWIGGIQRGAFPAEWAEQNVLASSEYSAVVSAPDPQRGPQLVVAQWYRDVLGREASGGEIGYWSIYFEDTDALAVLRSVWYSPEAVDRRTTDHYQQLLDRTPGAGEVAYWYDQEVGSDDAVTIAIATSAEYRADAEAAAR